MINYSPRIPVSAFGDQFIETYGEEIAIKCVGFGSVLEMLSCLFAENPFENSRLSLVSNSDDGVFIRVRSGDATVDDKPKMEPTICADEL